MAAPSEGIIKSIESRQLINDRYNNPIRINSTGGNGVFSLVFKAVDGQTGKKVALKFFDPLMLPFPERLERFRREPDILSLFSNERYVISMVDCISSFIIEFKDTMTGTILPLSVEFFPLEWADTNLEDKLYNNNLNALTKIKYFKEMIKGVFRVHRKNVCHRDLKLSNFLLCKNQVCVSDFGAAKIMDSNIPDISLNYDTPTGDRRYVAPEQRFSFGIADDYVFRADMFSMGAIFFELFTNAILTEQLYTNSVVNSLNQIKNDISTLSVKNKLLFYKKVIPLLEKSIRLPDIYSFNNEVPDSIKNNLNSLYKNLSSINLFRREINENVVHRKLDICILILENQLKYNKWRERRRVRIEAKRQKSEWSV